MREGDLEASCHTPACQEPSPWRASLTEPEWTLKSSAELRSITLHTPLNHNYTVYVIYRPSENYFCTPLSIKIILFATSAELRNMTSSHTSQSELHCFATSAELRNMPFPHTSRSELHGFATSAELRSMTISHTSQSELHCFATSAEL